MSLTQTRLDFFEAESNDIAQPTTLVQKWAIPLVNTRFRPP